MPRATRLHVVKHGSSAERSRHGPFVRDRDVDVCVRRQPLLNQPRGRSSRVNPMQLLGVAELRCVDRSLEKRDGFVVHRQRHRERMFVWRQLLRVRLGGDSGKNARVVRALPLREASRSALRSTRAARNSAVHRSRASDGRNTSQVAKPHTHAGQTPKTKEQPSIG